MKWIVFFFLAASISGMDQIARLGWESRSWLPNWWWSWDVGIGKFDAWHTYQALVYCFLFLLGYYLYPELTSQKHKGLIYIATFFVFLFFAWFQVRNLFLHVIWLKPEHWQFPFRQVL